MLAVAGGKGGCGKTTTALGLALAAARRGTAALAVDADVEMPDLHLVAGVDREPCLGDGRPDLAQPVPAHPSARVLPAPSADSDDPIGLALDRCRGAGDPVVVDCPAGAGPDVAGALRAADRTLVVTTPEPACLRDAAKTAAMSRAVDTPVDGAVVVGARRAPDGVADLLATPVVGTVPPANRPLRSSAVKDAHARIFGHLSGRRP